MRICMYFFVCTLYFTVKNVKIKGNKEINTLGTGFPLREMKMF